MKDILKTGAVVRLLVLVAIVTAALAVAPLRRAGEDTSMKPPVAFAAAPHAVYHQFPHLERATAWLNSTPLTADDLRGRVVLIDFWTYSCINWRRTQPYVPAWAKAYKPHGLVVIGVHTPEFRFEDGIDNVRRAAVDAKIDYPIALDNNYAIWSAFSNEYWPAIYLIDAHGKLRYHHFGEGSYATSERAIQALLIEAGAKDVPSGLTPVDARGIEAAADWKNVESPETYAGYERAAGFASPGGVVEDRPHDYRLPAAFGRNTWALAGTWTVGNESAVLSEGPGRVVYRFHARDLHLVMGSRTGTPIRFRVRIDGRVPRTSRGIDLDARGADVVKEHRLYQLIRQARPVVDRLVEIEFLDPGADVYSVTFG